MTGPLEHTAPAAELDAAGEFRLPNGVTLRRGGRVRVPKDLPWEIPNDTVGALGLELDHHNYSPGSEVIIWPSREQVAARRAQLNRILADVPAV